jgi:DNA invertase Pin-like site-specific DNA recombinase
MIIERVRAGMANAKAKGKRIGRVKKRNSMLIRSLAEAKLSYREIARIAKCSHGSVLFNPLYDVDRFGANIYIGRKG